MQRSVDIAGMRVMPFDQVRVVAVHRTHKRPHSSGNPGMDLSGKRTSLRYQIEGGVSIFLCPSGGSMGSIHEGVIVRLVLAADLPVSLPKQVYGNELVTATSITNRADFFAGCMDHALSYCPCSSRRICTHITGTAHPSIRAREESL